MKCNTTEAHSLPPPELISPITGRYVAHMSVIIHITLIMELVWPALPRFPMQPTTLAKRRDEESPRSAVEQLAVQGGGETLARLLPCDVDDDRRACCVATRK